MAKQTKKHEQLSEEEFLAELKKLSDKAAKISDTQIGLFGEADLGEEDIDTSFDVSTLGDTADPDKSHRLYWTMMMTMRSNLPKGKANEKLRRYIYEEKSLFLNRGKAKNEKGIRGSDERMAFIGNYLQVAFDTVYKWVAQGANPFDLYMEFYKLNKERGYYNAEATEPAEESDLKGL